MKTELRVYADLLDSHIGQMIDRLRQVPVDRREWSPAVAAPTALRLAVDTGQWLVADRRHVEEADIVRHELTPEPVDFDAAVGLLDEERGRWRDLLASKASTDLDNVRYHFGVFPRNVRFIIAHIVQQVIYKNGELATLYFAMGLDGDGPFSAPLPNNEYRTLAEAMRDPVFRAVLTNAVELAPGSGDVTVAGPTGHTPLKLAVLRDNAALVEVLVEGGADPNEADELGCTLLMYAAFTHRRRSGQALLAAGVDPKRRNRWGLSALDYARLEDNRALVDALESIPGIIT